MCVHRASVHDCVLKMTTLVLPTHFIDTEEEGNVYLRLHGYGYTYDKGGEFIPMLTPCDPVIFYRVISNYNWHELCVEEVAGDPIMSLEWSTNGLWNKVTYRLQPVALNFYEE